MAATIIPTAAFVRRLLPALLIEAGVAGGAVLAFVQTGNLLWIFLVPVMTVALLVWIVYLLRAHRDEWRWATEDKTVT